MARTDCSNVAGFAHIHDSMSTPGPAVKARTRSAIAAVAYVNWDKRVRSTFPRSSAACSSAVRIGLLK